RTPRLLSGLAGWSVSWCSSCLPRDVRRRRRRRRRRWRHPGLLGRSLRGRGRRSRGGSRLRPALRGGGRDRRRRPGAAVHGGPFDELRDRRTHGFVGWQLGFGVEVELALRPAQCGDDCVITGGPIAHSVEEVAEQKVQGGGAAAVLAQRQGTGCSLSL